jgi:REP element-mobilizing transposase RayT
MRWPEVAFAPSARSVVDMAIRDHATFRSWRIDALNVRSNHVHVVVDCRPSKYDAHLPHPDKVMAEFKSWGTRRLRDAGIISAERRTWTDHGSTRWLNHQAGHCAAVTYVNEYQDNPDRFEYERRLTAFFEHLRELDEEWKRSRSDGTSGEKNAQGAEA